jgi:hypothetical protein
VATLIRGYYHQVIARGKKEQLLRHPIRMHSPIPPSPGTSTEAAAIQYRFVVTKAQSAFASIVLADALRKKEANRAQCWTGHIGTARKAIRAQDDSLPFRRLRALADEAVGVNAAVEAAQALGIMCRPRWVENALDVGGGAATAGLAAMLLTPPIALPVIVFGSAVVGGLTGGLLKPVKKIVRQRKRLEELAKEAPGVIDYVWDA